MTISFDFDRTLSEPHIQKLAKQFAGSGCTMHITTTRRDKVKYMEIENSEVFEIAAEIGISKENIQFTNYEDKVEYVKDFDFHFDDDEYEIDLINRTKGIKCKGILIDYKRYD